VKEKVQEVSQSQLLEDGKMEEVFLLSMPHIRRL